jgi:hypothetical protein
MGAASRRGRVQLCRRKEKDCSHELTPLVHSPIRSKVRYDRLPIQNVVPDAKKSGNHSSSVFSTICSKDDLQICASCTTSNSGSDYEPHHITVCIILPVTEDAVIRSHAPWRQQRRSIYLEKGILIGSCSQPPNNRPSRSGLSDGRMALNDDVGRRSANDGDLQSAVRYPNQIHIDSALDFPVFWLASIIIL